jgi:hypothetical protein
VEVDAIGEGCALVQVRSVQITMLLVAFLAIIVSEDNCLLECDAVYSSTGFLQEATVSKRQQIPVKY